jgi:hypothetical protein
LRLTFCVACGCKDDLNYHHLVPQVHGAPDGDTNLITSCRACHGLLHNAKWSMDHAELTKAGLAAAKQRGQRLGGWTAGSERSQKEANAFAERMRPLLAELADLSATAVASELNARKIATATGGKWYAATVIRLRERLKEVS